MKQDPQIRKIAKISNLELAWQRVGRSTERTYREYFRSLYRAYDLAVDERFNDVRNALLTGSYEPSSATKVYLLKSNGLQRVYTLLSVEYQLVYQAIANLIADRLLPHAESRYYKSVFGHLYSGPG